MIISTGGRPAAAEDQPATTPQPSAAAAAASGFDIMEFEIEGNTLLPALEIERAVYPFLGPKGSIQQVEKAREALEKRYHDAGYLTVFVDIPEQQVREGLVKLRVSEAKVERLRIVGSRYYSLGHILSLTPSLAEGTVPYFPEVQEELAALNRSPDRRITPVLKPGREPGTVQVELNVKDQLPVHGSVELNDRYSANTTRLRAGVSLRYDNLWQREHSLALNYITSPERPDDTTVASATYLLPVGRAGSALALYAVATNSDVAAVGALNVIGQGTIVGARYVVPLPAVEQYYQTATFGIDRKDFKETLNLTGSDALNTPITYIPFITQYGGTLQSKSALTQFNIAANFAMRGFLGNNDAEFASKRFKAHANYLYLRGDIQHTQALPSGFTLVGQVNAQVSGQPLISNEQFAVGGAESVRGYLEAEQFGDEGVRGMLELRTPSMFNDEDSLLKELRAIAFIDGATVRIEDPLPGQQQRFRLLSAGLGMRLKAWKTLSGILDVAWPFKDTARTQAWSPKLMFRLAYDF